MPEMQAKRINPEMIRPFRIACRNVPGHTFVETELCKKTEERRQAFFAVPALLFHRCELRNAGILKTLAGALPIQHLTRTFMSLDYNTSSSLPVVTQASILAISACLTMVDACWKLFKRRDDFWNLAFRFPQ